MLVRLPIQKKRPPQKKKKKTPAHKRPSSGHTLRLRGWGHRLLWICKGFCETPLTEQRGGRKGCNFTSLCVCTWCHHLITMKEEEKMGRTKSPDKMGEENEQEVGSFFMHCCLKVMQHKQSRVRNAERPFWNVELTRILPNIPFAAHSVCLKFHWPRPPPPPPVCLQGEERLCHECRLWTTSRSLPIELHSTVKQTSAVIPTQESHSHGYVRSRKGPDTLMMMANAPVCFSLWVLNVIKSRIMQRPLTVN